MIEFTEKAEDRIKDEYMKRIYVHMFHQANKDPVLAAACRKPNKTLEGVIRYVMVRARGKESGGCAVIAKDQVYAWARSYMLNDNLNYEGDMNDRTSDQIYAEASGPDAAAGHRKQSEDGDDPAKSCKCKKSEEDGKVSEGCEIVKQKKCCKIHSIPETPSADMQKRLLEEFYEGFGIRG